MTGRHKQSAKNRRQAIENGDKFYEGKPCNICGVTTRYTKNKMCLNRCHNARWRDEDPDRARDSSARTRRKIWREYPERIRRYKKKYIENNHVKYLISGAKARARDKGCEFSLTDEFINSLSVPENCPCCGQKMEHGREDRWNSPSIDKIVNEIGYIDNNIIIVCTRCNARKSDSDEDFFRFWLETITKTKRKLKANE